MRACEQIFDFICPIRPIRPMSAELATTYATLLALTLDQATFHLGAVRETNCRKKPSPAAI